MQLRTGRHLNFNVFPGQSLRHYSFPGGVQSARRMIRGRYTPFAELIYAPDIPDSDPDDTCRTCFGT